MIRPGAPVSRLKAISFVGKLAGVRPRLIDVHRLSGSIPDRRNFRCSRLTWTIEWSISAATLDLLSESGPECGFL